MSESRSSLKRNISLPLLVFYGTGTILGAGIFVVIGEVIAEAYYLTPVAYIGAGLVASLTALSYGYAAALIPKAGGPIDYSEQAFKSFYFSSVVGWLLTAAQVISAATIVTGFSNYFQSLFDISENVVIGFTVALATLIAVAGIKQSAWLMAITTSIGMATLVAVIFMVSPDYSFAFKKVALNLKEIEQDQIVALFSASILSFYSFVGFGDMSMIAEEVKNVKKNLPLAIKISIAIVLVFYLLVSLSVISSVPPERFSETQTPLVFAVVQNGWAGWTIGVPSLFIIINGALTQLITASRLLMELARNRRGAPKFLKAVNKATGTPIWSTLVIAALILTLCLLIPLKELAIFSSIVILIVFAVVNFSVIQLKKISDHEGAPQIASWIPWLGGIFCICFVVFELVRRVSSFLGF